MDARQMLTEARQMILAPEHWTRGAPARAADGRNVQPDDENATQWCALGALSAIAHPLGLSPWPVGNLLLAEVGWASLAGWNDNSTHAQVLAVFDAAIERVIRRAERAATGWESVGPSDCQIVGAR